MKTIFSILFILMITPDWVKIGEGYDPGDRVTDFKLKNVDGNMVSMSDYTDAKGIILAFTCNTCPFSILYEQRIIDLHNQYASQGFPVIAINPNDPKVQPGDAFEYMQKRSQEKNYPFPYLVDETQEVARAFGATNTPHLYILKKTGDNFIVVYVGAIDNNPKEPDAASRHYVKEALEQLINGKEIKEAKTKAIGCGIKWKS